MTEPDNYDKRDEETGQFTPTFEDDEFVQAIATEGLPTTSDVADKVGCEYRTAYERLTRLEDDGKARSRKVGNSLIWFVTDEG